MFAALITVGLFSFAAISGRRLTHYLSGTEATLFRLTLVVLLLAAGTYVCGSHFSHPAFPYLFASGCVGFGIGDLSMFQAYPRIGTRRTTVLIQCLAAPFGALLEWTWLHHAPTWPQAGFGALILAGVGIALMPAKDDAHRTHGLVAGISFGVLAALCQGGGVVLSRKAYEVARLAGQELRVGVVDSVGAALQRALGGILVTSLFFLYLRMAHKPFVKRKTDWPRAWPWLIASGVAGPALGVTCLQWALMMEKASIVLPIIATTPLAVMPLAHYLEGDRITPRALLGAGVAVAGVIGLTLAK